MAGFSLFNQTTTTTTPFATPNLNTTSAFGVTPNQQNVTFGAAANSTFGATTNTSILGTPKPQFGSPNSSLFGSPNTGANQTGLSFGSTTQTPGFAQTQPPTTPLNKPVFGTLNFNSTPTTQVGLSFGATPATQSGSSSNTTAAAPQTGIAFGTPANTTSVSQTGITFGTPSAAPQTGLSFVTPTATTTQTGISFGLSTSTNTTGLAQSPASAVTASATTTKGLPLSFGTPTTSQPTLSFGTGFNLATTSQSTAGTSTLSTVTTSVPTLFGGLTAATSTPASSTPNLFGDLTSAATTASTSTTGGIFSWQKPTSDSSTPSSLSATSVGLGGIDHSAITTTQSSTNTVLSAKEQPLPNEIQQTVLSFKEHVKTQKNLSSEVARSSAEPLTKLTQQISALNNLILNLGSVLSQQKFTAEKIKLETIKSLNDYELAQKIKDSPVTSEERVISIRKYFTEKISAFEESTKVLQEKIEYVYQHVSTLPQENSLSAEALKLIVKKLHDSFVVIGARAYKLHNDMQLLKVQYMTLRNQYVKDSSSISFSLNRELQLPTETRVKSSDLTLEGPNPFSRTGNGSFNSLMLTSQNRNFAASTSSSNISGLLNTSKPFGFSDISGVSLFDQSTSAGLSSGQQFNLQKPPLGNKRGKR